MEPSKRVVRFEIRCRAQQVYLSIVADEASRTLVVALSLAGEEVWSVRLRLTVGTYRYRYYVDDGQSICYRPAPANRPGALDGMDAILQVPAVVTDPAPSAEDEASFVTAPR